MYVIATINSRVRVSLPSLLRHRATQWRRTDVRHAFFRERCGSRDSRRVARVRRARTQKRVLLIDSPRPRSPVIGGNYKRAGENREGKSRLLRLAVRIPRLDKHTVSRIRRARRRLVVVSPRASIAFRRSS